jgi:hypothetical protein
MSKMEEPTITKLFRNHRNQTDQRRKTKDQAGDASIAHRLFDAVQPIFRRWSFVIGLSSPVFSFVVYQGGQLN